jgi:hypothetical protein
MWQHIICFNCDQNSCIIVACDNMYTMKSKDEFVFVDFFLSSNTPCCLQLMSHVTCPRQLMKF